MIDSWDDQTIEYSFDLGDRHDLLLFWHGSLIPHWPNETMPSHRWRLEVIAGRKSRFDPAKVTTALPLQWLSSTTRGAVSVSNYLETTIIYENKTDVFLNRRRSAELDCNPCICGHTCLTNDDAIRRHATGAALCAKDHDGRTSVSERWRQ